jgi:hypothetical protein
MYEIAYVKKHDMAQGLLATEDIDAGTRILAEAPHITLPLSFLTEPCNALREAHFGAFVERELNTYQLAVLKDLTNNNTSWHDATQNRYGSQPYVGTVKTNTIPIDVAIGYEKYRQVGVFPTLSKANHACKPNAHQTWNRDLQKVTLHAIHDIKAGEEITITYRPDSQVAPRWIQATYCFHCRCEFCQKDGEGARKLKRQTQLTDKRLDELMHDFEPNKSLQADLANCWERHVLCENAGIIDWRAGMVFLDGFHVVLKADDLERAEVFAEYVKKTVGFYEGEDSVALRRVYKKLNDFRKDMDAGM